MQIKFLGATGTVTGSRYLLTAGSSNILIDCGLFQGYKQLRLRNWAPMPFAADTLDAVVLTHAHLDHSGALPLLVRSGFRGKIFCSESTADLCRILLPDSGRLLEEEANYANRHGFSKHAPALPLYSEADAVRALALLAPVKFGEAFSIGLAFKIKLERAGHILGAAILSVQSGDTTITFSGDLGRMQDPIMAPPTMIYKTDYLVVESTYGDRIHNPAEPTLLLGKTIRETAARGGVTIIPSFSVGRAQTLMYLIHRLKQSGEIPSALPVHLNSPMAVDATQIYRRHRHDHRLTIEQCEAMCHAAKIVNTVEESIALNLR
jgi:metallo-beta-lactamase family protein